MIEATTLDLIKAGKFVGRVDDLPADVYHAAPYLSNSGLVRFAESPAHFKTPREDRREVIGTGTHKLVLEGQDAFSRVYEVGPDVATRAAKEWKDAEKIAKAGGRTLLKIDEDKQIRAMAKAVMDDPVCAKILSSGAPEVSLFWVDAATGVRRKARLDWLCPDGMTADLKYFDTVTNIRSIESQCHRMKYHWQAAYYLDAVNAVCGIQTNEFVHVFMTEKEPFSARPFVLGDASLERARMDYWPLIEKFAECLKSNHWPVYERPSEGITRIELPSYAW